MAWLGFETALRFQWHPDMFTLAASHRQTLASRQAHELTGVNQTVSDQCQIKRSGDFPAFSGAPKPPGKTRLVLPTATLVMQLVFLPTVLPPLHLTLPRMALHTRTTDLITSLPVTVITGSKLVLLLVLLTLILLIVVLCLLPLMLP